jgi:hypothetical protein
VTDVTDNSADFSEVDRSPIAVMFLEVPGTPEKIAVGWDRLEELVGDMRGRRLLGLVEPEGDIYRACVQARDGDSPERLGLSAGTVPGGRYLRLRLHGEPPAIYRRIALAVRRLERAAERDGSRPLIEHFRSREEIDVLMPVTRKKA